MNEHDERKDYKEKVVMPTTYLPVGIVIIVSIAPGPFRVMVAPST
jgi:hypothetical protein